MFVYRTTRFDEQVAAHNLSTHVEALCAELTTMNLEQVYSRFERVYPYLKRKERNLRLVARIRRVGGEYILCWLAVFKRGDHEYQNFLRDRENFHHHVLEGEIQDGNLREWLISQKASSHHVQAESKPLRDDLRIWLQRPKWQKEVSDDVIIYESEMWLKGFSRPEIKQNWRTYYDLIHQLVEGKKGKSTPWENVQCFGKENHYILFSLTTTVDNSPRPVLFLLTPYLESLSNTEIEQVNSLTQLDQKSCLLGKGHLDDFIAISKRAYPSYLLADEDSWLEIQNCDGVNFALSAEEEAILHSVSTSNPSLPLFLNGRAGSGKSTMLFHLFADYCYRYLSNLPQPGKQVVSTPHPLFLVYNERLLNFAKERVIPLLVSHHRFLGRGELNTIPDLSPFFKTFRTFLQNLLPLEERDSFLNENYISFCRFRQLCQSRKLPRNCSPELCWSVIRTFIKGYHLDERDNYMSPDDYLDVPQKEKTVSVERFEAIYSQVWNWYKKRREDFNEWDDQDLIRRILQLKCYPSEYTAIFCDEAQDFTRLELQLIMRLSVFSNYDLEYEQVPSLPFAFAGDPLQTLNPTGFRWASLKSAFYNEVITALSPSGNLGLQMNFAELECNYRSIPPIVGVNNLIQLWRAVLFDLPEVKPQQARKPGKFTPQKFILSDSILAQEVKLYLRDTIIIIPCDEGGERDFVQEDELLSELVTEELDGKSPWNVLSAIAAKGLEFKQVVLYKFGDICPGNAWRLTEDAPEEVKYFFNKLYVAASRATERLFIVDTPRGEQLLWKRASDESELEAFLSHQNLAKARKQWQDRLQLIPLGEHPEVMGVDDLEAIAETFETEGLSGENSELLRRAQGAYKRLNNQEKELWCEAWALKFEEHYREAGNLFRLLNKAHEAWDCLWQGMCWNELLAWYDNQDPKSLSDSQKEVISIVHFILAEEDDAKSIKSFSKFLEKAIAHSKLKKHSFSKQWQNALQTYGQRISLLTRKPNSFPFQQWQQWGRILKYLAEAGYSGHRKNYASLAGDCFYIAQINSQAVLCWEQAQKTNTLEYNLAKAELLGMPAGLEYLAKVQAYERILNLWKQAQQPRDRPWLTHVAPALEATSQDVLAFQAYIDLDRLAKVKKIFEKLYPQNKDLTLLQHLLKYYSHSAHGKEIIATLETYSPPLSILYDLVYELSLSPITSDTFTSDQRQYLERLIKEQVLSAPNWQESLKMQHIGIALEKIGSLVETLEFYERFDSDRDRELRKFARDRWLATKRRQQEYFRHQSQIQKAEKVRSDIQKKEQLWGIPVNTISLEPPTAPKTRPTPPPQPSEAKEVSETSPHPLNIKESPTEETSSVIPHSQTRNLEVEVLQIQHLKIKILKATQTVFIQDILSETEIRIKAEQNEIQIGAVTVSATECETLSFSEPTSGYRGYLVVTSEGKQLKLFIRGVSYAVVIKL